jgi:hypothetical protein
VVEVAAVTMLVPGREPFEDLPVQADGVSAGAEREPVEVDGGAVVGIQRRRVGLRSSLFLRGRRVCA